MEAGIYGFGHGQLKQNHLAEALALFEIKTHSVSKSESTSDGSTTKLTADTYTNAEGVTQSARPNAAAIVTTRDDLIHSHLAQTAHSKSIRKGDTTSTHSHSTSRLDTTDHATIEGPKGTTTIDARKSVDAASSGDSTSVRKGDTTKTQASSASAVKVEGRTTISGPGGTTTIEGSKRITAATTAASTATTKVKSASEKLADGTKTVTTAKTDSDAQSKTDFHVEADGKIVDSHGHTVTLKQTGQGTSETFTDGSSKSKSTTVADTDRHGKTTNTSGATVTQSSSESDRKTLTSYEGVLSSTTSNGKTTTQYIDYVVEDDVRTVAKTKSVDQFSAQSQDATSKSGKGNGTVTQTVDQASESQSAILSQRTDQKHVKKHPDRDGDATVVKATDSVDASSVRETAFQNNAHIVTSNGAVTTITDRKVSGETVAATQSDAVIKSTTSIERAGGGTNQTVDRTTDAQSETEAITSYDSQSSSSSSNGASSSRTDHVVSQTEYDVERYTKYIAFVRTVVTNAAASSSFAASA